MSSLMNLIKFIKRMCDKKSDEKILRFGLVLNFNKRNHFHLISHVSHVAFFNLTRRNLLEITLNL